VEGEFFWNILLSLTTVWHLCPGLNAGVFYTSYMNGLFTIFTLLHIDRIMCV